MQNNNKGTELELPFPFHKCKLSKKFLGSHTFGTLSLSNLKLHGAMLSEEEFLGDLDFTISFKILDYSYLNMLYFIEEVNIKSQLELSGDMDINTTVDVIKMNIGTSILQTLVVSKDHWERSFNSSMKTYPVLTRYIICNGTNIKLMFSQVDTKQKFNMEPGEVRLYSFLSDFHDQKLVLGLFIAEKVFIRSDPICVDDEGVQYVRIAEYVLIVKIKKLSTTQVSIFIRAQVHVLSMASEELRIQLYYSGKNNAIPNTDVVLEQKAKISFCTKLLNKTEINMRLKFRDTIKGWSGEIPLRSNKSLPWLVKVPLENSSSYVSYWVRVIREDISQVATNNFKPQRVLVIIWPMFMIRSMLPSPVNVTESTTNISFELKGRGDAMSLIFPGNHETEHEITFGENFVTSHGEKKNLATLTFRTIDWNKFFWFDEKLWTTEHALSELSKSQEINWPSSSEIEKQIKRASSGNDKVIPIFRCLPSQDFSCSLMLDVCAWALFINSLSTPIEIRNYSSSSDTLELKSNHISTLFGVQEAFTICIQEGSSRVCSDPIYIFKTKPTTESNALKGYFIEENGSVIISLTYGDYISKFKLNSSMENGYRLFTLLPLYVIANFSKHSLKALNFCIAENEHVERSAIINISEEYYAILAPTSTKSHTGTSIGRFYNLNASSNPRSPTTQILFYVCLKFEKEQDISQPIPINKPLNRKCFSLPLESESIPLAACVIEHKEQYFLNIYDDPLPAVNISNCTDLSFFVAQAESLDATKETQVTAECDKNFTKWYQVLKPSSQLFYTPPEMYKTFPDIEPHFAKLALAIINDPGLDKEETIEWSKPIRTDRTTEKYFSIPFRGDIKVVVCDKHKIVRMCIFYTRHETVFCVKDLRSRLINTNADSNALLFHHDITDSRESESKTNPLASTDDSLQSFLSKEEQDENSCSASFEDSTQGQSECIHKVKSNSNAVIKANLFIKEININVSVDSKEKKCLKTEIFSIYIDDMALQFNGTTRKFDWIISNLQVDNQLFSTGNYDFPVILCSEELYKRIPIMPTIYNLSNEIEQTYKQKALISVHVKFYDEEFTMESVRFRMNPIRAYIEDTYLNDLLDYLIECNPGNIAYIAEEGKERINLAEGCVLLPKDVVHQVLYLSEPLRLKSIRIDPMSILISVHTCVRLYIALDHSPLEFSSYEKTNIITLPLKFGHALGMHYLSGALFGAGWVVGSLEILGSPSGLARSFSIGLRDFVSMPVQGLLRGPWGFVVGITHGSVSLLRNVTAGTVNSVTKLAASVARNLDRLTLDEEHFQRTEALRRSRPQGFTEGFTQGLTGFGISLLGAVGGFARHTLEATSPVGIVTGVGKGIVGAFAKPISGAAELVALTGQGMLHTVGFNAMPKQRFPTVTRNATIHPAECKIAKLLPDSIANEQILFFHEATLVSGNQLRRAIIFMTNSVLAVLDIEKRELTEILPIEKIEPSFDENDRTLINLHLHLNFDDDGEERNFTNQRIMNYLKSSDHPISSYAFDEMGSGRYAKRKKLDWSFYMNEQLGQHLLNYLRVINKNSKAAEKSKF